MDIYFTDEEIQVLRKALHRYTKEAIRQVQRSRQPYLEEINRRVLAILASIEKKISQPKQI